MSGFAKKLAHRTGGLPRGVLGRFGGRVMAKHNAPTERHLVRTAALREEDTVLVLGPGPGVGLAAAAEQAGAVIGVEPSSTMREVAARRCAAQVEAGRVVLRDGTATATGLEPDSADVALTVNNVQLWADLHDGLAEVARVLRPGGRLLLSVHERFVPDRLDTAVRAAGFGDVQSWRWQPEGKASWRAYQLRATLR